MNLYASVKDENGNIIIIRDSDYKTRREFKETLSMNGFKIRFVCLDDEDIIEYEAEKYEYKLQRARENAKYRREWLKTKHAEPVEPVPVEEIPNAEPVEKDFKIEFEIMYKSKSTRFDTRYSLQSTKVGTRLVNNIVKHGDIRLYGHIYENGVFDEDVYADIKCTLVNEEEEDYMITSDGLSYECCLTELQKTLQEAIDNMKIKLTKDTELKRYMIEHDYKLYDVSFNDGVSQSVYCKAPSEEIAWDYIITTKKLTCNVYLSLVKNTNEIKRGKPILKVPIDFVKPVADVEKTEPEPVEEVSKTEPVENLNKEAKIMPKYKAVVKKHNGVDIEGMGFIAYDDDITKASKKARKLFSQGYSGHYRNGDGYIEIFRLENGTYIYDTSCYL